MRWHKLGAALAAATLPFAAGLGEAAAQSIRHEVNGQTQTYDLKQQRSDASPGGQPVMAQAARKPRASLAEPSRGPKGIPWDEPGKISGVPGVLEGSATSLPVQRAAKPKTSSARRSRAEARTAPDAPTDAQDMTSGLSPNGPSLGRAPAIGDGQARPAQTGEPGKPAPAQPPRAANLQDAASAEDAAKAREEAEARARIIAEAKARALAEEQRRLEVERSKDRHARRPDPPSPAAPMAEPGASPVAQLDPASTGALATSRRATASDATAAPPPAPPRSGDQAAAAQPASSWTDRVCRTLFFGIMPGC